MNLARRMAGTAAAVGLAAGLLLTVLQAVWVLPLIEQAERYEEAGGPAAPRAEPVTPAFPTAEGGPQESRSWSPSPGVLRIALTLLANLVTGLGFALLLVGGLVLHGKPANATRGLVWGAAGYAAFMLAPALGLPPELPGAVVAPLAERQWWWVGAVAASAAGLALLTFLPPRAKAIGIPLLLLPHLLGAPDSPLPLAAGPPSALVGQFVAAVLVTNAVFWAVLGCGCGWLLGTAR